MNAPGPRMVTSLDLPELRLYRTLRRQEEHRDSGLFVAEGEKVVRRLLESGLTVTSLLLTPEWYDEFVRTGLPLPADIFLAPRSLLETITGFRLHQGVMGTGEIPRERSLDELMKAAVSPPLVVALDRVEHVDNVGVIVRNCAAFGVEGLIVGPTSCSPWLRRAVRNSMGTVFRVPTMHVSDLSASLLYLRDMFHLPLIVTSPDASMAVSAIDFSGGACIVVGSEGLGVSREIASLATHRVSIPMSTGVDSLNVAVATAVVLYEARRGVSGWPSAHR